MKKKTKLKKEDSKVIKKSLTKSPSVVKNQKKSLSHNKSQKTQLKKVNTEKRKKVQTEPMTTSKKRLVSNNQKQFYYSLPLKNCNKKPQKNKNTPQRKNSKVSVSLQSKKSKIQSKNDSQRKTYLSMSSDSSQNVLMNQQKKEFELSMLIQTQVKSEILNYGMDNLNTCKQIESLTDIMERQDKLNEQNLTIELKRGWTKHKSFGIAAIRFFNSNCQEMKYKTIFYKNGQKSDKIVGLDQQINNQMQQYIFDYLDENVLEFQFLRQETVSAFAIWNYFTNPEYGVKQVIINYQNNEQLLQILQNNKSKYVVNFSLVNLQNNLSLKKLKKHILQNLLWKESPSLPIKNTQQGKSRQQLQLESKYASVKFKNNQQTGNEIRSKSIEGATQLNILQRIRNSRQIPVKNSKQQGFKKANTDELQLIKYYQISLDNQRIKQKILQQE